MSFTIEILEEKKNPIIDRTEVKFRIDHFDASTPNRLEVKKKIAAIKNANEKFTIIRKIQTHFGGAYDVGLANIYEEAKELQFYEPFHIQVRNLPKDTRSEIYKLKKRNEPYGHLFAYE
ncbi:MAG: 30S ribosomal protein S24e [Candidatus Lokiarchaeota archaeon]|nr:30S ribosomal protein S24e [Candidatus Lokiarchaeota archaeon]